MRCRLACIIALLVFALVTFTDNITSLKSAGHFLQSLQFSGQRGQVNGKSLLHSDERSRGTGIPLRFYEGRALSARPRFKLAYVILGSGTRDDLLVNILKQLRSHLLPWTPGDVIIFHTGEYDSDAKHIMITHIIPNAKIMRIPKDYWQLPKGLNENDAPFWKYAPCCPYPQHGIGYRHMCRWFSNYMFKFLDKLGYQWVFRLDEDSEVLSDVPHNVVDWMEEKEKLYGFRLWDQDDPEVIWSLPELTAWYMTANDVTPYWLYESCRPRRSSGLNSWGGWDRRVIYNNMFMANIAWWLSEEVQAYLDVIDKSNGYYLYRWGDAPIHTMVVRMLLARQQVHMFGFAYCHKGNCDRERKYYYPALKDPAP